MHICDGNKGGDRKPSRLLEQVSGSVILSQQSKKTYDQVSQICETSHGVEEEGEIT